MGRKKKPGKRARGIQSKKGYLYIIHTKTMINNGKRESKIIWEATGLPDSPENVKKAIALRDKFKETNNSIVLDRNTTFEELMEVFLNHKKRVIRNTTYSTYENQAKSCVKYFASTKVRNITTDMVEAYIDHLFTEHNLAPRTVKDYSKLLRTALNFAVEEGIISPNPARKAAINAELAAIHSKKRDPNDTFFSYSEAQRFLKIIRDHELYEFFYVSLYFALRREETLGIRWSAIKLEDPDNPRLVINHSVTIGTQVNRTDSLKTEASYDDFPLDPNQVEMFKELKKREENNRILFGNKYVENDYVFKHADGTPFYPDYPSKIFKKIIDDNPNLPQHITLHGLRKSCVSILVHRGLDIESIRKWARHKDVTTTLKIYTEVKDKEAKENVARIMTELLPYTPL